MECIFCKIAKGEIEANVIYESENVIAFLDVNPANKGHCLVIPKQHYESIFDVDEEVLGEIIKVSKKIAKALRASLICDGINLLSNNGKAIQLVKHFHFHVIPRFKNDKNRIKLTWTPISIDKEELKYLRDKIKKFIEE